MKKTKKIICNTLFYISLVVFLLSFYVYEKFPNTSFEQLLYTIKTSKGTSVETIIPAIKFIIIILVVFLLIKLSLKRLNKHLEENNIKINIKAKILFKIIKIDLIQIIKKPKMPIKLLLFFLNIYISFYLIGAKEYIKMQMSETKIFNEYYNDPKSTNISFPKQKQNLIYIYVESLESTYFSKTNGGLEETSLIPNLEQLAIENISFSNTKKLGGAVTMTGTSWTVGSLVAQTSGIPLKLSIGNKYSGYGEFLPGAYSLGEILKQNGYNNYFLLGSDSSFGGRKDYFKYHGDYKIMDYNYIKSKNYIKSNYHKWWGVEDKKLYKIAKKELLNISKENKPFNFTILTADTHFPDGYIDNSCPEKYDSHYKDSVFCSDLLIKNFIDWLKDQKFYKNTTIIIVGDHLTMEETMYKNIDRTSRTIYNTIINSKIEPKRNKERQFSVMDMFPTTLASIGSTMDNERMGMGTNLFSDKKTLIEELGYSYLINEFEKKSIFYDNMLLQDSYYIMQNN